jgi:copper chaperone CopZ
MKAKFSLSILFLVLISTFSQNVIKAEQQTIYFPVLGNCYLCQLRIEEAVNKLDGIVSVYWNYDTKITTVTYNDEVTDAHMMMHVISAVGHDTEWFPAPDSAYNALVGTCCEYERTNDYTNVQVGYLSLMDLWVFPVGIDEEIELVDMKIYPTAGTGVFHIEMKNRPSLVSPEINVYSMNGIKVHTQAFPGSQSEKVNLQFLSQGHYIIILTDVNKIIARSKLIKL